MITALEYLKAKQRISKGCNIAACGSCPLGSINNGLNVICSVLERKYPEKAIEIMEIWAKDHPIKTFLTDFLEKYPNAPMDADGMPNVCPSDLGYTDNEDKDDCDMSCQTCWNRELEEENNNE